MASPLTLQPDATAGKDSRVVSNAVNTNLGTDGALNVGDTSSSSSVAARSFLAFDHSEIPAIATIDEVIYYLWEASAEDTAALGSWAVNLRRILLDWTEAGVTWAKYDGTNAWNAAGCSGDGTDRVATPSASVTLDATAAGAMVPFTGAGLTADWQGYVQGTFPNYGHLLSADAAEYRGTTGISRNSFRSSDYVTAAQRPKAVITYHVGTRRFRAILVPIGV